MASKATFDYVQAKVHLLERTIPGLHLEGHDNGYQLYRYLEPAENRTHWGVTAMSGWGNLKYIEAWLEGALSLASYQEKKER